MTLSAVDVFLAELKGTALLADLPRPKVPYAPETLPGAFCLWRTNGHGPHVDTIRRDPTASEPVTDVLRAAKSSTLRAPGGSLIAREVEGHSVNSDTALLDRLTSSPGSTGYLMARSLDGVLEEPAPSLDGAPNCDVRQPGSTVEYLDVRLLTARMFGGGGTSYNPDADFYSAPDAMSYLAVWVDGVPISAASILIVNGIANIWSVCTDESARGRGAASVVVHACLVEAHRRGANAAALGTSRELSRPGGLYSRLGFDTVGHETGWRLNDIDRLDVRV